MMFHVHHLCNCEQCQSSLWLTSGHWNLPWRNLFRIHFAHGSSCFFTFVTKIGPVTYLSHSWPLGVTVTKTMNIKIMKIEPSSNMFLWPRVYARYRSSNFRSVHYFFFTGMVKNFNTESFIWFDVSSQFRTGVKKNQNLPHFLSDSLPELSTNPDRQKNLRTAYFS